MKIFVSEYKICVSKKTFQNIFRKVFFRIYVYLKEFFENDESGGHK